GSVTQTRRKRMAKTKHRKVLRTTRHHRRNTT
ncbi:MAG: 30S ribosomal protein bS22, partial [Galactobacter sp.]